MVNLCSDDNSNFVGMQSMFGKYSINDGSMLDTSSNYATGNVSGTCQTLNLNPSLPGMSVVIRLIDVDFEA